MVKKTIGQTIDERRSLGYPTNPVVEVEINERVSLMVEIEVLAFKGFGELERKRYEKRILEAKKRGMDVATLDGRYLKWYDFLREE